MSTYARQLQLPFFEPSPVSQAKQPKEQKKQPNAKLAARLRGMADRLAAQIDDKRRPMTQNLTPRRNRMYQSRLHDAANLERLQKALYALADAHERGDVPLCLEGIKTKTEIAPLVATRWTSTGYYTGHDSREFSDTSLAGRTLQAMITGTPEEEKEAANVAELRRLEAETKLKIGRIPGFFPTPDGIARQMVRLTDIRPGMSVLEPSAGSGAIADAVRELCPDAHLATIELSSELRELLKLKGHYLCEEYDFLRYHVADNGIDGWHRIVMNPPFQNRQDCAHVRHAYDCLQAGGRVVAVMSAGTFFAQGAAKQFREWLDDKDWYKLDLPLDTFKESGTGINACIVVIDK